MSHQPTWYARYEEARREDVSADYMRRRYSFLRRLTTFTTNREQERGAQSTRFWMQYTALPKRSNTSRLRAPLPALVNGTWQSLNLSCVDVVPPGIPPRRGPGQIALNEDGSHVLDVQNPAFIWSGLRTRHVKTFRKIARCHEPHSPMRPTRSVSARTSASVALCAHFYAWRHRSRSISRGLTEVSGVRRAT